MSCYYTTCNLSLTIVVLQCNVTSFNFVPLLKIKIYIKKFIFYVLLLYHMGPKQRVSQNNYYIMDTVYSKMRYCNNNSMLSGLVISKFEQTNG